MIQFLEGFSTGYGSLYINGSYQLTGMPNQLITGPFSKNTANTLLAFMNFGELSITELGLFAIAISITAWLVLQNKVLRKSLANKSKEHIDLQKQLEYIQHLSNATFEGILVHKNEILIDTNHKIEEYLRTTKDKLIGKKLTEILPDQLLDLNKLTYRSDEEKRFELGPLDVFGQSFYFEIYAKPFPVLGEGVRLVAIRDITPRRNVQDELLLREKYLETISNIQRYLLECDYGSDYLSLILKQLGEVSGADHVGVLRLINADKADANAFAPLACWSKVMQQENAMQSLCENHNQPWVSKMRSELERKLPVSGFISDYESEKEWEQLRKIGIRSWLVLPIFVRDRFWGSIGFYNTCHEKTYSAQETQLLESATTALSAFEERKTSEMALAESEKHLSAFFNNTIAGIMVFDKEGHCLLANDTWAAMFGYEGNEVLGMKKEEFTYSTPDSIEHRHWLAVLESQLSSYNMEQCFKCKDGHLFWGNISVASMFDDDGELSSITAILIDIQDKKRAEQALRVSEDNFKHIFDESPFPLLIISADEHTLLKANNNAAPYINLDKKIDIRNSIDRFFVNDNDRDYLFNELEQNHRISGLSLKIKNIQNKEKWVILSAFITHYHDEKAVMIGFADITDQVEAQLELDRQYRFIQTLMDNIPNPVYYKNIDGNYLRCNKEFEKLLDKPSSEIIGKTDTQLFDKEIADRFYQKDILLISHGQIQTFETRFRDPSAIQRNLLFYKALYGEDHENEMGIIGTILDITTRKHTEEQLKISEANLSGLIESTNDSIASFNEKGEIQTFNTAFYDLMKKSEGIEVQPGSIISEELKGPKKDRWRRYYKRVLSGQRFREVVSYTVVDGGSGYLDLSFNPIVREDKVIGFTQYGRDISQIKQIQEDLRNAKTRSEMANRAKSDFLANMSHEIRTPMNAVLGFAELLDAMVVDPMQKKYIASIKNGGKSLLTLINDILDLSKIEAGKMELNYNYINLRYIVKEVMNIFEAKAAEKNLKLITEIPENLPAAFFLDETRIRQILLNLIGNAVKFTEKGHVKLGIKTMNEQSTEMDLKISVIDTGIGIPKDGQQTVFESFKQHGQLNTRKYGGTGLGLSITKRLVEMMNGSIGLYSQPDMGSNFTVNFSSVKISSHNEEVKGPELVDIDYRDYRFEPAKILVVDDIPSNRDLLGELFRATELEVHMATNGLEAIKKTMQYKPNLILMDLVMPEMDGYTATRKLRENPKYRNLPIIAITASVMKKELLRIKQYGFDGFLTKPVKINSLYQELLKYLPHKKLGEEDKMPARKSFERQPIEIAKEHQEYLSKLVTTQLEPLWKLAQSGGIEEAKKLGQQFLELGKKFEMRFLTEYGSEIIEFSEDFDIINLENTLVQFTEVIKNLYSHYQQG